MYAMNDSFNSSIGLTAVLTLEQKEQGITIEGFNSSIGLTAVLTYPVERGQCNIQSFNSSIGLTAVLTMCLCRLLDVVRAFQFLNRTNRCSDYSW